MWTVHCNLPLQLPVIVKMMFAVRGLRAVTTPVPAFTVATPVLSLLHAPVPPPNTTELAVYVVVAPTHTGVVPVTDAMLAFGVTVINCLAEAVPCNHL